MVLLYHFQSSISSPKSSLALSKFYGFIFKNCCYLCVCVCIPKNINITCSVCIIFHVCMISWLVICHWITTGVISFLWKTVFPTQHSLGCCNSLYRVMDLWAFCHLPFHFFGVILLKFKLWLSIHIDGNSYMNLPTLLCERILKRNSCSSVS